MRPGRIVLLLLATLLPGLPRAAGQEDAAPPLVVVHAEGAVERMSPAGEATLLEIGEELTFTDRVALGQGAVLSVALLEGPAAGHVAKLSGPAEGAIRDLLAGTEEARSAGAVGGALLDALRAAPPAELLGPGVTRAAEKGPLRPVYPSGEVAGPCRPFVFVAGVDDLGGGHLELRVFDEDPERGAEPVFRRTIERSPVDLASADLTLEAKEKYWWQGAAILDGEEVLTGEPVAVKVVKSPVGQEMPPQGFDSPEARGAWHLMRARAFTKARLYLDAWLEYGSLSAAGGGSSEIDRQQDKIAKKLALDEEDVNAIRDLVAIRGADEDVLCLSDGRELSGQVLSEASDAVIFAAAGTRYRVLRSLIREIRPATRPKLASAAPFLTVNSRRYVVSANTDREFAEEAARHLEALFDTFGATLGKYLGARNAKNLKAVIYRDETDFRAYVDKATPVRASAAGFYDMGNTTLYLFRSFKGEEETTWRTLLHEGTHQILHLVCNEDPDTTRLSHFWLAEAIPCYMESLVWDGKKLVVGPPNPARVEDFARLAREGKLDSLTSFFHRTQAEYGTAELYDQGLAVLLYILSAEDGALRKPFFEFAKSAFQNRPRDGLEEKAFRRPLADVAKGYEDWFLAEYGR